MAKLSRTAKEFLIDGVASTQYGLEIIAAIEASANGASPGGPFNSIQYNQAGSFNGVPSFSYTGSSVNVALPFIVSGGHALVLRAITGTFSSFHTSTSQVGNLVYTMPLGAPLANAGYFLTSDTSGQWSWALPVGSSPAGSNQAVQYNNSGSFGGGSFVTDGDNVSISNVSRFHFRSLGNPNWVMGSDIGILTTPHLISDVLSIVVDNNVGGGFAIGGATGQVFLELDSALNAWFAGAVNVATDISLTSPGRLLLSNPTDLNWYINRSTTPPFTRQITGNNGSGPNTANTTNIVVAGGQGEGFALGLNSGGTSIFELTGNDNTGGGVYSAWFAVDAFQVNVSNAFAAVGDVLDSSQHTKWTLDDRAGTIVSQIPDTGEFKVQDAATRLFLHISPSFGVYDFGDVGGFGANTHLLIQDTGGAMSAHISQQFFVANIAGNLFLDIDLNNRLYVLGDKNTTHGGSQISIDDNARTATIQANGFLYVNTGNQQVANFNDGGNFNVSLGDVNNNQNHCNIFISDTTQTLYFNAPLGGGNINLIAGNSIENQTVNSFIVKDAGGVQYLNINPVGGAYSFGNLSTTNYITINNTANTTTLASSGGVILAAGLKGNWPTFADNAAATLASLPVGQIYMADGSGANIQGTLMARY